MYQPLSFNVIRQALDWHAFPTPTLRQLSFNDNDPEEIVAEYLAMWTYHQVEQVTGFNGHALTVCTSEVFQEKLQQCFCEDVEVREPELTPLRRSFFAVLYVRLSSEVISMAKFRDEI